VSRKSRHHVKILDVNYFITTGTITIDPDIRYKHKGFDALLTLLEEKHPRRAQRYSSSKSENAVRGWPRNS